MYIFGGNPVIVGGIGGEARQIDGMGGNQIRDKGGQVATVRGGGTELNLAGGRLIGYPVNRGCGGGEG